jgi:hypothetical protein
LKKKRKAPFDGWILKLKLFTSTGALCAPNRIGRMEPRHEATGN